MSTFPHGLKLVIYLFSVKCMANETQGHPMDLFLKICVLQANFCWLEDIEEKNMFRDGEFCRDEDNCWCRRAINV